MSLPYIKVKGVQHYRRWKKMKSKSGASLWCRRLGFPYRKKALFQATITMRREWGWPYHKVIFTAPYGYRSIGQIWFRPRFVKPMWAHKLQWKLEALIREVK